MIPKFELVKKDALEFLNVHNTAVISTSWHDVPSASTVYYIVDEDFNFYFLTKENTAKALNIAKNPNVAVVVGTGPGQISVTAQGVASKISGEDQTALSERLMMIMLQGHIRKWPAEDMAKFKDSGMQAYKVVPSKLTYMNLDGFEHPETASNRYVTIIP